MSVELSVELAVELSVERGKQCLRSGARPFCGSPSREGGAVHEHRHVEPDCSISNPPPPCDNRGMRGEGRAVNLVRA
jgi:hypothetical protein